MMFDSESQLRRWLRNATGGKVRWIEPALGATLGMPDAVYILGGYHYWIELKIGDFNGKNLIFSVTKEQKKELIKMRNDGAVVVFLIAVADGLIAVEVDKNSVNGKIDLEDYQCEDRAITFLSDDPAGINRLVKWLLKKLERGYQFGKWNLS